jgi:lipid II:glycine glycyltransferase (peptidoglycan interpeptide bridge formation enzyme)
MKQNSFVAIKDGGLFQSSLWREFQVSQGKNIFDTEEFFGIIEKTYFGNIGYIPRGPEGWSPQVLGALQRVAKEKSLIAIRVEPQSTEALQNIQKSLPVRKAPFDVQPREFLMMNLEQAPEELLARMKSKWRYNIRLAEKQGVVVTVAESEEDKVAFVLLMSVTAQRKNISFHAPDYYESFINFFKNEKGELLLAKKDGEVLAGVALVYYQGTAYYVHGGSSNAGRNLMAPHLLQWRAIERAKACGLAQYDFGGVAAVAAAPSGKDWSGITRFKQGFAPNVPSTVLPGAYDIIFSQSGYTLYRALTRVKKLVKKII